ncbi:MAG: zinc-dependent dehydrogenase [Chloroflexota bacterium]
MRAVVLYGPNDLRCEEVPTPSAGPGELLLRTRAAAVCGTDLRIVDGTKTRGVRLPSIIGHELAGEVHAIGAGVTGFAVGDRVSVTPIVYCRSCYYCTHDMENMCANNRSLGYDIDGGFAEYTLIPAEAVAAGNVFHLPAGVSFEAGALAEPLACCLNGSEKSRLGLGQAVLVAGAGPIGLMHVQLARSAGAREVIVSEPSAGRRERALALGATAVVDAKSEDLAAVVRERTGGIGVDAAIMAIGAAVIVGNLLDLVRKGGVLNLFAGFPGAGETTLSANAIHYKEVTVIGTSSSSRRHYARALEMIAAGGINVESLITNTYSLADTAQAIAAVRRGDGLRAMILPWG